jgi:hypothetical protein
MDGIKVENVTNRVVLLGDNYFESGAITIAAAATVAEGTVLKRLEDGKFAPVVNTDTTPGTHGTPAAGGGWSAEPTDPVPGDVPVAVMPFSITNSKAADADFGFRALVGGARPARYATDKRQPHIGGPKRHAPRRWYFARESYRPFKAGQSIKVKELKK